MRTISIIGCGVIGSSLAVKLVKFNLCKVICLYDYDFVSPVKVRFPFYKEQGGMLKVEALKSILQFESEFKYSIICYPIRVIKQFSSKKSCNLIIDCRDDKRKSIGASFSVSLEGNSLVLDNRKNIKIDINNRYTIVPSLKNIDIATNLVADYIRFEIYKTNNDLFLIDLKTISGFINEGKDVWFRKQC